MHQQIINGATKLVGIIGNPVRHSLSPLIHNHAFSRLNLPFAYIPLCVGKGELHAAMLGLRAFHFAGANVTIPYKTDVVSYCDILSELSQLTNTVNTLYFKDNLLCGTTTDAEGFFGALQRDGYAIAGKQVVILGNGGTARTLGFAIAGKTKAAALAIIGRNRTKVESLCFEISEKTGRQVTPALFDSKESTALLHECTLLINCTSVGMSPHTAASPVQKDSFHAGMYVFDTIYNPLETQLRAFARAAGCKTQNGLRMLLYQGLASFTFWTGVVAKEELFDFDELKALVSR